MASKVIEMWRDEHKNGTLPLIGTLLVFDEEPPVKLREILRTNFTNEYNEMCIKGFIRPVIDTKLTMRGGNYGKIGVNNTARNTNRGS